MIREIVVAQVREKRDKKGALGGSAIFRRLCPPKTATNTGFRDAAAQQQRAQQVQP